jgi:FkbM family methyltransferase
MSRFYRYDQPLMALCACLWCQAICPVPGTVNFTNNPSIGTAGVRESMSDGYIKSWGRRFRRGDVVVPCRPISALIRLAGISTIDFFSLDVEGAELVVLQTFDWTVPVKVFCIELDDNSVSESDRARVTKVRTLLFERGYLETDAFKMGSNKVFIHGSLNSTLSSRMRYCRHMMAWGHPSGQC